MQARITGVLCLLSRHANIVIERALSNDGARFMYTGVSNKEVEVRVFKFSDLKAWQIGHNVVVSMYKFTSLFPKDELFGLVSQMRRAAVSITSNLAEGFGRQSVKEKLHFYSIAHGSLTELQNQWLIAQDVGFISTEQYQQMTPSMTALDKVINGLMRSTRSRLQ